MTATYSLIQWLAFFYLYCFAGWIWETSFVSIKQRHFVNRGFLRGPLIPIYGSGAVVIIAATLPFHGNMVAEFFSGMIFASILEYCTGAAMEAIFKVRYWDYSDQPLNLNGHIFIGASLLWGVFSVLVSEGLHPWVAGRILSIDSEILRILVNVVTLGFIIDFSLSLKAALDLRDVLIRMEAAKAEMARMQKRMDVIIALTNQEIQERLESVPKPELVLQYADMRESFNRKMEEFRQKASESSFAENYAKYRDEVSELRARFELTEENREALVGLRDRVVRSLVRSNPAMVSKKYKEALEEIKNKTLGRK